MQGSEGQYFREAMKRLAWNAQPILCGAQDEGDLPEEQETQQMEKIYPD